MDNFPSLGLDPKTTGPKIGLRGLGHQNPFSNFERLKVRGKRLTCILENEVSPKKNTHTHLKVYLTILSFTRSLIFQETSRFSFVVTTVSHY